MSIIRRGIGKKVEGQEIYIYTLSNDNGLKAEIMNYGGCILCLYVPDKNGVLKDVVLGFEKFEDYTTSSVYFGALIGRSANRIEGGKININGVQYDLAKNNGNNHLHGGNKGFDKVVWNSEICNDYNGEFLKLSYLSKDGEENYPGNMKIVVKYRLNNNNELVIEYFAESDKDTVANLTNHSYFNLGGHDSGDILNHKLKINGDKITAVNSESIPKGEIRNIIGTPMDFTNFKTVGKDIDADYDQLNYGNGYDHNWIVNGEKNKLKKVAEVIEENSGRKMITYSTMPGVQFYTGNFLNGNQIGKEGVRYGKRAGLCLETQYFPNALANANFESTILKAGDKYNHTTIYKFETI